MQIGVLQGSVETQGPAVARQHGQTSDGSWNTQEKSLAEGLGRALAENISVLSVCVYTVYYITISEECCITYQ